MRLRSTSERMRTAPTEQLALNFEEIKITSVDHDGSKGGNIEFEWSAMRKLSLSARSDPRRS